MSRDVRRVALTPGYVLHHRPYRDTSRILEVLTREHGRISLFARAVRGPKARLASVLQPFRLLLLSWSGRGEAAQLSGAEYASAEAPLPPGCLMPCFYLNELLLKLTTRHDPLPALFDDYDSTIRSLREGGPLQPVLRIFEKRLLESLGYGLNLAAEAQTGRQIEPRQYYHFRASQGLVAAVAETPGVLAGESLLSLAAERLESERALEDARRLLQAALAQCLDGRELSTRAVARSIAKREIGGSALSRRSRSRPSETGV